jgi:cellulose synthase/poly-beta-1,6-N-acetylglucosamine synthase-like glycosyltransferase
LIQVCYFINTIFKYLSFFLVTNLKKSDEVQEIQLTEYPLYTILIPLYKEAKKVVDIVNSINSLDYPKDKLDVKIIVEEDDYETILALSYLILPIYYTILKVPFSFPRTKPKALNYALPKIYGEYVTIYDAEDQVEVMQLKKAVNYFFVLPENYVCLQAKLGIYNAHYNLLAKFFSIEYKLWFEYFLKGLSHFNMSIPLGGSSNHLKVKFLRKLGGWDSYNVTEDADLGIRIYQQGYKTGILDSYTWEVAPQRLNSWLFQRSRWIKGFIQTFLVFVICQRKNRTNLNKIQIISIIFLTFLNPFCFFILPWLLLFQDNEIYCLFLANLFVSSYCLYNNALYILLKEKSNIKNFSKLDFFGLLLLPFYFLLHSIASYIALWEIIFRPFKWNKTDHSNESI